mmetsp:Transcript_8566/g.34863  ORF Transcript_8566/g.34863 Transcript_8566/m.34863 type:complete len:267 (-) Transcript_8566:5720-6520(-)
MTPGVSCIAAKATLTFLYRGMSSCSRFSRASFGSRSSDGSLRCMAFMRSGLRNLMSTMPSGSNTPARHVSAAYISIISGLMVGSMTTHAPPRSSPSCGTYTNTGWRKVRSASTMYEPYLRISPNMSRRPPAKPRKLANIMSGRPSSLRSFIICTVLHALSGNHTVPACCSTWRCDPSKPGSAGTTFSVSRVSTAMAPMGVPPRRARPHTTVLPQPMRHSVNEPRSKKSRTHVRGSLGARLGTTISSRLDGSLGRRQGSGAPRRSGT